MKRAFAVALGIIAVTVGTVQAARLTPPAIAPSGRWHDLTSPQNIWPCPGAIYYSFNMDSGSRAHLIVVDVKSGKWQIRPALATTNTAPTSTIATQNNASAAINGAYFNLKGDIGASASYVVIDGVTVGDPHKNKSLVGNQKLQSYLPQIMNRSEVRFLENAQGRPTIQIAQHNEPSPSGAKLVHLMQAGPRLLPALDAEGEAFVRTNPDGTVFDAISARKEAARTAFGITPDGYAMMLTVAGKGQDPESSGISLEDLASLMKDLGCSEAINLDGGASSTMYARLSARGVSPADNPTPGSVVCGKNPETTVKSILILEPAQTNRKRH